MAKVILMAVVAIVFVAGCDERRLGQLEKENEELKAEAKKTITVADYDLQAKCSRDAKAWFNENWARDKDTLLLDFTNHYNKAQNKCFILVEYHYSIDKNGSWTNDITLWDIYENSKYGNYLENTMLFWKPKIDSWNHVIVCDVLGTKCKTLGEFNDLVRPYLNN